MELKAPIPPKLEYYHFNKDMQLTHPGKVLLENYLKPANMTPSQLADIIKVPRADIIQLVQEHRPMTIPLSVKLGRYFGLGSSFFMHIYVDYKAFKYSQKNHEELSQIEAFK